MNYGPLTEHLDTTLTSGGFVTGNKSQANYNRAADWLSFCDSPGMFPRLIKDSDPVGIEGQGIHLESYLVINGRPVYRVVWELK